MATLTNTHLTLTDLFKQSDDPRMLGAADVIEVMNQANRVTRDIPWMECNLGTTHRHTIRTGLPKGAWGELYKGTPQSKSERQQVEDTTGFYEQRCSVDQRLLELAANKEALRSSEARPHIEAMTQELASTLFYADSAVDPRRPKGLAARFGNSTEGPTGNQIIKAGGSGSDNTSIWMVTWGENSVVGLYPKGIPAGIQQIDRGTQRVTDENGNAYYVEEEDFKMHCGFAVMDWRNISRVANIDVSELQAGNVDIYKFLRLAFYRLNTRRVGKIDQQLSPGRTVIYCNRDVLEALDAMGTNSGGLDKFVRLRPMEIQGEEVMSYRDIPIVETDAILNTEAAVA